MAHKVNEVHPAVNEEITGLLNHQYGICVSMIFPTEPFGPGRAAANLHIEKMIEQAKLALIKTFDHVKVQSVLKNLEMLYNEMDFLHMKKGLGFFVSESFRMSVHFPFPVKEKIVAGNQFELRDLLFYRSFDMPWLLLSLAQHEAHLYKGGWNELIEIRDGVFPADNEDQYEFSRPARSSSLAGHAHVKMFEKDKSEMETIILSGFYKKIEHLLGRYFNNEMPLVLNGSKKDLAVFKGIYKGRNEIAGMITGNYQHTFHELQNMTWDLVYKYQVDQGKKMIEELREKIGQGRGVTGIKPVWKAVHEGRGHIMLVEKDFQVPGFLTTDNQQLYLKVPARNYVIVSDLVEQLSKQMIHKKQKLFFVENGSLQDFGQIALITRY